MCAQVGVYIFRNVSASTWSVLGPVGEVACQFGWRHFCKEENFFCSHFKSCNSETRVSNIYRWSIHTNLKTNQKGQTWKTNILIIILQNFTLLNQSATEIKWFTSQDCYSSHVESVDPFSICSAWSATPTNSYL